MDSGEKCRSLDLFATAGVAAVMVGAGFWNLIAVSMARKTVEMSADMGAMALPLFSRLVFQSAVSPVLQIFATILLLVGFWVLFTTRDRLRGVVYGMVVASIMAMVAILTHLASMIVWLQLVSSVE